MATRAPHLAKLLAVAATVLLARGADSEKSGTRSESFDHDPGWEGYHNRIVPGKPKAVVQDFGYSRTHYAGKADGEVGGQVWRAAEPAYYAARIGPRTLDERLSASGTFAVTKTSGGGIFFGFFRAEQAGAGGRPVSSLGLDLGSKSGGARLAVRLITGKNQSCGTFITPFIPGKFRPLPIRNDGTRYAWTLEYDPQGAGGRGRFTLTLDSAAHKPGELERADMPESFKEEARRRFPSTRAFSVDLPEGFKQQGTAFDHFGLMNVMKPGGSITIYFGDLHYDGRAQDLTRDPNWDASGNRAAYNTTQVGGAHDFGFSNTRYAGGQPGEVGGTVWRTPNYAYYADRVGPLTLEDRLEASGKVVLKVGAPDSDMFIGWFNSTNKTKSPAEAGHFLGVHVGGPTRIGHYFQPSLTTAQGGKAQAKTGPALEPGKVYQWSLAYHPAAQEGQGAIQLTLGQESVTLALKKGMKVQGASFDRFGLFNATVGGQVVRIYLDDLQYTASRPGP